MPISISNSYIETFEGTIRHLAQQSDTRLRRFVTEKATTGEKHNWDRLASSEAIEKTGPRISTPVGGNTIPATFPTDVDEGLDWDRRVSIAETWHTGEIYEQEDPVQMLIDPNSSIAVNLSMNMRRAIDDILIEAATGDALDGDGAPVSFPAGQVVGDGTGQITLDVVLEVQEKFYDNDVDPDISKVFVIGPKQQRKLMQLMEVTSGDYQNQKALATGILPNWMGFTWIVSTRLLIPGLDELSCLAFSPRAIGFQVNKDLTARIAERADLSFAWQLYCHMTMGAVRTEDEHIVHVHLADTI